MSPDEQLKQDVLLRALDAILGDSRRARLGDALDPMQDVTAIESVPPAVAGEEDEPGMR